MALRIREDGRILCAAMHPTAPGDTYLHDGISYRLTVELEAIVTEPMHCDGGRGGHAKHGEWWWRDQVPADVAVEQNGCICVEEGVGYDSLDPLAAKPCPVHSPEYTQHPPALGRERLEDALDLIERLRGGDEKLTSEEYYARRDALKAHLASHQGGGEASDQCEHADQPHTVWWWNELVAEHSPIPDEARFDNQADALKAAKKLVGKPHIAWIKVFRSDNESYTCWRWDAKEDPHPEGQVER